MARVMDASAVNAIIQEMNDAGASASAKAKMANTALRFSRNLTECGRAEWKKIAI